MKDPDTLIRLMLFLPFALGCINFLLMVLSGTVGKAWHVRFFDWLCRWVGHLTIPVSLALFVFSLVIVSLIQKPYNSSISLFLFSLDIRIDALGLFFILLVNSVTLPASWNTWHFLKDTNSGREEASRKRWLHSASFFHASINLFHFTMLLVSMVNNLVFLWVAIELTTVVSALLVGYQDRRASWEAAWKYLIITSTGIILALFGTMFLANAVTVSLSAAALPGNNPLFYTINQDLYHAMDPLTGTFRNVILNWSFLRDLAQAGGLSDPPSKLFIMLSFLLVLVGYGTKAGLAPMHTWLPDGHGEAPAPISALLSGVLLKSAFYAILRFYTLTNLAMGNRNMTSILLIVAGLFSLLVSTPFIIKNNPFKRVLAYHSLEHLGIIALGVGIGGLAGGTGGQIAMFGALLHTLNHALTKSLMFLGYGNITRHYGERLIEGVLKSMPVTGSILTLGGLTLVGMPPFSIFLSELIIVWGALQALIGDYSVGIRTKALLALSAVLLIVTTVLIFYGLVRHLAHMMLGKPPNGLGRENLLEAIPLLLLLVFVLGLGFGIPAVLSDLIMQGVTIILAPGL